MRHIEKGVNELECKARIEEFTKETKKKKGKIGKQN